MAAFTAGNIVIYRIGGTQEVAGGSSGAGATALTSAATPVFLDEYTPNGTFVQSIPLPTTQSGTQDALTASGTATSEGGLSDSGDGQSLLLSGYNVPTGTASVSGTAASATANQRVVGVVSANGTIDTSTNVGTFDSGNNPRGAASQDGTGLYISTPSGIAYTTKGSTATPTANAAAGAPTTIDGTNTRQIEVVGGQLYYSTSSGTTGIYTFSAAPTTTQGTGTADTGTLLAASPAPLGFFFANLSGGTGTQPSTLYVADTTNGIEKFVFNGTTYTAAGNITTATSLGGGSVSLTGTTSATQISGITGTVANGAASLYVTTGAGLYKLTDSGTGTLAGPVTQIAAAPANTVFREDAVSPASICYVAGTLIRTTRGDIAVEALAIGDLAVTACGAHRPIRWLGHRRLDLRRHARPHEARPIRIAAHAFGPSRPARDLLVSPGHSICIDVVGEVLIPAAALVNGATIHQVEVDTVTYWHVELDSHDVILAENLPAESYLDMGDDGFFLEDDIVALDRSPDPDAAQRTHADFCRPFHDAGPLVEVVRAQLARRAKALGWRLDGSDTFAGLHLVVDGARVDPVTRGLAARFLVPAGARDVWLESATSRPCEIADSIDDRDLGVCIGALTVDDGFGAARPLDLADPLLCIGFHAPEATCRWTAGRARLPAALLAEVADDCFLRVDLAQPAMPRWAAPAIAEAGGIASISAA